MPGPNFISQAELDDIRAQQIDMISEIGGFGDIKRATYVSNNKGGYDRTLTNVGLSVPMRVWISSGPNGTAAETRFWGEQELSQTDAFLVVAWNQDLQVQDIIIFDGREWEVVGVQATDTFITAKRARLVAMR